MKKTQRISTCLCIVALCTSMLLSFSACTFLNSDEKTYESAISMINDAKQTENRDEAIQGLAEAIARLEKIPNYQNSAKTLAEAKTEHDKLILEEVKILYKSDYSEIEEWLPKLYDQKKAESVTVWLDFSSFMRRSFDSLVDAFKKKLKDPNSFVDIGSTVAFTPVSGPTEKTVTLKNWTYTINYTATNSFGGRTKDSYEHSLDDYNYTFVSDILSSADVAKIINYTDFGKMCDSLFE